MTALATLDELKARLDWTLDADETRIATSALEDASILAWHYGNENWTALTVPVMAKMVILKACMRYLRNPEGVVQSRAGDETMAWSDSQGENAGTVYFTRAEIESVRSLAYRGGGLSSAPMSPWGETRRKEPGYVPAAIGGDPIPFFAHQDDPW